MHGEGAVPICELLARYRAPLHFITTLYDASVHWEIVERGLPAGERERGHGGVTARLPLPARA
eukprot:3025579-Prymnesium_polylepis.1